jgi:murein DD-endopeptidase MepM/ murein hydrolase activator NlpD
VELNFTKLAGIVTRGGAVPGEDRKFGPANIGANVSFRFRYPRDLNAAVKFLPPPPKNKNDLEAMAALTSLFEEVVLDDVRNIGGQRIWVQLARDRKGFAEAINHSLREVAAKKLYVSGSHNGIDLRASMGTAVKSAASGVVVGTGDTDPACRGASYGKWVLVKHNNGLTTVYGHLSLIKVAAGQTVGAGQLLAYSGQSGYATGPHLHLSVFASDTVTISNVPSKVCRGATLRFPVAPTSAYLDPMAYL